MDRPRLPESVVTPLTSPEAELIGTPNTLNRLHAPIHSFTTRLHALAAELFRPLRPNTLRNPNLNESHLPTPRTPTFPRRRGLEVSGGALAAVGMALTGVRPARADEGESGIQDEATDVQKAPEAKPLTAAEQMIAEKTELIGTKSYLVDGQPVSFEIRAGQGAPGYFGLRGKPETSNPNIDKGVPDELYPVMTELLTATRQYQPLTGITLLTLAPGDPLFNAIPIKNRTYRATAYQPSTGPEVRVAEYGAEVADGHLTFMSRPVRLDPGDASSMDMFQVDFAMLFDRSLINGGADGFDPFALTQRQAKTLGSFGENYIDVLTFIPR